MHKKKLLIILLGLTLLLALLSACGGAKGDLLQEEADNVEKAVIYYYDDGAKIELDAADGKELANLAKALASTRTEEKTIDMNKDANLFSAHKYAIDLTYTDAKVERLFSGDGAYFFRFTNNDQAYIGGENSKIADILEEIKNK